MTNQTCKRIIFATESTEISMSHEEAHSHDEQPEEFLDTVFDKTVGGFGIFWVSLVLVAITLLLVLG